MKIENAIIQAESFALKKIYKKYVDGLKKKGIRLSQESFGKKLGWTQGAVSNYLNGLTALNANSATFFAKELGCSVVDFSPRLDQVIKDQALSSNFTAIEALILKKIPIYNGLNIEKILKNIEGVMAEPMQHEYLSIDNLQGIFGMHLNDDSMGIDSNGSMFVIDRSMEVMPKDTVLIRLSEGVFTIRKIKVFEFEGNKPVKWQAHPVDDSYPSYSEKTAQLIGLAIREVRTLRKT